MKIHVFLSQKGDTLSQNTSRIWIPQLMATKFLLEKNILSSPFRKVGYPGVDEHGPN